MAVRSSVLIVDDEVYIREALAESLSEHYKVYFAKDGIEAIKVAGDAKPSAIVLDYNIPELNGVATCRQLRNTNTTQDIPIIMISAYGERDLKNKCMDAGANEFLPKPFHLQDLLQSIKAKIAESKPAVSARYEEIKKRVIDFDLEANIIRLGNKEKKITPLELKILKYLADNLGKLVKTSELTQAVWGHNQSRHRPLGPHIASIRKTLHGSSLEIVTLYAHGFVLRVVIPELANEE